MSKKKKRTEDEIRNDLLALQNEGYKVVQYGNTHWRIFTGNQAVDIWPTSKKYMVTGGDTSHIYTDIISAVKSVFWKVGDNEQEGISALVVFKRNLRTTLTKLGL